MPKDESVFSVDTHLFRELGDLLVGRDSTALFELIKNAYDADASVVTVTGSNLHDTKRGEILVVDNGCGMSNETFRKGFLRVASRLKDEGDRRSPHYHRRFTGAKGIGRLSAHKLASLLKIISIYGKLGRKSRRGTEASIDWDAIELLETLDEIEAGKQVVVNPTENNEPVATGTQIILQKLRRAWTDEERENFIAECQSFRPPSELIEDLTDKILTEAVLFDAPTIREIHSDDPGFTLELKGEFKSGQSLWPSIQNTAHWVIEIDAKSRREDESAEISFGFAPTVHALKENPHWNPSTFTIPHPRAEQGPFFQGRVFLQLDPKAAPSERKRVRHESGIRMYVEGFRILPYGEPGNDWLSLDADYSRRSRLDFREVVDSIYGLPEEKDHWEELSLANRSYFGGIFFTQNGAVSLRPLINREGFLPDEAYLFVRNTVRQAIDLCTRVRASSTFHERQRARDERRRQRERLKAANADPEKDGGSAFANNQPEPLQVTVSNIVRIFEQVQETLAESDVDGAEDILAQIPSAIEILSDSAERVAEEAPMIRVLASVGTQMAAFVHEIRTILNTSRSVEKAFENLLDKTTRLSGDARRRMESIKVAIGELRRHLERQSAYLIDVVSPDARRRRSRQPLAERFDSGTRMLQGVAEDRRIAIVNDIPPSIKSPPMFPAELTTIFSNLLTNAIKAAKTDGLIRSTARTDKNGLVVRVENTGVEVDLSTAERWFRPFESSTVAVDADLGQGMGLGLTITRNMLEPYGAQIKFVKPSDGFSTAIQITFPV